MLTILSRTLMVLLSIPIDSHVITARPDGMIPAVRRGSRYGTARRNSRRLEDSTSTPPSELSPNSTDADYLLGTGGDNETIVAATSSAWPSPESGAGNDTAATTSDAAENVSEGVNDTIPEIVDAQESSNETALASAALDDNSTLTLNESAVATPWTTAPPTVAGTDESAAEFHTHDSTTEHARTPPTSPSGTDWNDKTQSGADDDAANYTYSDDDDEGLYYAHANDDAAWDAPRSPSKHPTPRPTYEYTPSEDDMLAQTEMNAGEFRDDYVVASESETKKQQQPQQQNDNISSYYLEGVESVGEMERDKNVRIVAGVLTAVFVGLWLLTAQQTMENPDGLCASICRLTLKFLSCLGRILFLPCRYLCCKGSAEQVRSRRSHAPMRAPFPSDLELS